MERRWDGWRRGGIWMFGLVWLRWLPVCCVFSGSWLGGGVEWSGAERDGKGKSENARYEKRRNGNGRNRTRREV
jgi:hypothetical protein